MQLFIYKSISLSFFIFKIFKEKLGFLSYKTQKRSFRYFLNYMCNIYRVSDENSFKKNNIYNV